MPHFIHLSGSRTGGVDEAEGERMVLGRGLDCQVRFHAERDGGVGKEHAEVVQQDGRFVLHDLGSRNGTYVNGRLVLEVFLRQGDVIRLGAGGPQVRIDLSGKDHRKVIRSMRRRRWRVLWVPVTLLVIAGLGFGAIYVSRAWNRQVEDLEAEQAVLDGEIDSLLAVLEEEEGGLERVDELGARYDRLTLLEADAELFLGRLTNGRNGNTAMTMDDHVDEVLTAFGEPIYRVPQSFREAVRAHIGAWLGTRELDRIFCASEAVMPAMRPVLARYSFPDVVAFLPWVLSGCEPDRIIDGKAGLWAIGEEEGRALELIADGGDDLRLDPLASTEAIADELQRDLQALGTSSVLLATVARDPEIAATVEALRQRDGWTKDRRTVRFLWLAKLLDDDARNRIPLLVGAAVVGRNPDTYGLDPAACQRSVARGGD